MKDNLNIPSDYSQKLTLDDVKHLNWFKHIEKAVKLKGFYTCLLDNTKTLILP